MRTARRSLPLLVALALITAGRAGAESSHAGVGGRVLGEASPLAAAGVYAYQLADTSLHRVLTDSQGNFLFRDLPAGLYKIIAHKPGFVPVVVLLTRTTAQAYQFVELQLIEQQRGAVVKPEDFWSIRSQIPGDVLRDIQGADRESLKLATATPGEKLDLARAGFVTTMQAVTGVDQISSSVGGQVSGGGVGIEGRLGQVDVGLRGNFWQINSDSLRLGSPGIGQASSVSLDLASGPTSRLHLTSLNNRLTANRDDGATPMDFEHYQVNWSQGVGESGRSEVSAQYTAENNYHNRGVIGPLAVPDAAARTWRIEGNYTTEIDDRNTLQTGLRYRALQFGSALGRPTDPPASANVDLFGRGGTRIEPQVLLEYGLYSTLSDGTVSLMPQGGIVLQLGSNWQVEGSAAHRAYRDVPQGSLLPPTLFEEADLCEQGSQSCYQVSLARKPGKDDDGAISLTAIHRTIGETLQLYFSNELFDGLESLYLVRGDQVPELHLQMSKHVTPRIITKLESSLAAGGGGTFLAADRRPYENRVRYLVASLDTQFLSSSTGVFVAFHQLSQELNPIGARFDEPNPSMELQQLRLVLTQNLKFMFDLAADWAVQLNMEVSRGPAFSTTAVSSGRDNELRRRLMGGIAVKF